MSLEKKIAVIDYGGANISSLTFALSRLNAKFTVTNRSEEISSATHIILPGVGAAKDAMQKLSQSSLIETIKNLTQPTLGICLGMQLLFDYSMEENIECLGIIGGECRSFDRKKNLPVPHMGWNNVSINKKVPLTNNFNEGSYFYFVHSFYTPLINETVATTKYVVPFSSIVQKENFMGTQFHPEKSGKEGSKLLGSFINL